MIQSKDNTEVFGSFFLNSSEFALVVKNIQEVVNPPEKFTSMPLAPPFLLGIFNLRGSIIPVVDLKTLLNLESDNQSLENKKIAIVEHGDLKIGLLFDSTGQIFRSQHDDKNEFDYAATDAQKNIISGALKLEGGKRIVQILNVHALLKLDNVPLSLTEGSAHRGVKKQNKNQGTRMQCISFLVGSHRFGLGIEAIHEIIKVPQINDTALSSEICLGMLELRGDIVPVVDFAALLKYRPIQDKKDVSEDQRVIIMKIGDEKFGLLIESVESIITYYTEDLLNLPMLSKERAAMFIGCLSKEGLGDIILFNHKEVLSNSDIHEMTQGHSKIYQSSASRGLDESKKRGQRKSYITFKIDSLLALGIDEVKEIIEYPKEIIQPPGLSKFIKGMLNLRGQLVTILDTRSLYAIETQSNSATAKIVVFERKGVSYGMIVDSVENIISFSEDDKMKIPEVLYKGSGSKSIKDDVKFAVEIEIDNEKKTLLVLDLDPLTERIGMSTPTSIAA
jgi:purine-binding chemotaxis protein CheW